MGKKLIEELREKVRKKHESVIEESKKVTETLRTLEKQVAGIDEEASVAANSLLKERNKEKVKGRYTEVMQRLEHCYNELFLINSSLPGNTEEEGDSSSSSDSEDENPVGGATSTPHTSYHAKPDLSPSFIPDTSSHFTLRDLSKLGLTVIFKDEQAVAKEESATTETQHGTAEETLERSINETSEVPPKVCSVVKAETVAVVKAEENPSVSLIKSDMGEGDSVVNVEPAPVVKAEDSHPAPLPKVEESQAAPVVKAEVRKPPSPVETEGNESSCAVEAVQSLPVSAVVKVEKEEEETEGSLVGGRGSREVSASPTVQDIKTQTVPSTEQSTDTTNIMQDDSTQTPPAPVNPVSARGQEPGAARQEVEIPQSQVSQTEQSQVSKLHHGVLEPQSQVLAPQCNIKTEPSDEEQSSVTNASQPQPQTQRVSDTSHGTKTELCGGEELAVLMSQCSLTSPKPAGTKRGETAQVMDTSTTHTETRYPQSSISQCVDPVQSPVNQPKAAFSQQVSTETTDPKTVTTKPKEAHQTSQTDPARAESPVSDTHSVKSDKSRPRRPKRATVKAPSTKTLPSSRASSVAGDALEPCGRIPPMKIIPDKEYGVVIQVVESPWLLWVQPFSEDFDDLIDSMSAYYEHLGANDVSRRLDGPPVVGMYVCSRYSANGDWYRAMVTHVYQREGDTSRSASKVRVFYVDFGNSEDRNVQDLRPLQKKFSELPTHAVPCALAEVAPLVDSVQWTKNESLAILLMLKSNESVGLKHAVFSYEPGSPLWFVHIYVPQAVPRVHIQARSGPITQEMICVSEHLVNNKLAQRLPNDKVVKHIKQMKLTESVSDDARYVVISRMETKKLISALSPPNPGSGDVETTVQGNEGRESPGSSGENPAPSNSGDVRQSQTRRGSGNTSPSVTENKKNLTWSKSSPSQDNQGSRYGNKAGESQSALYQEWAQAWKKVSDPQKTPAVRCSTSLTSTPHNNQDDTKSSPHNDTKTTKTDTKNRDKEPQGSRPTARRPTSDHQHVHIPPAGISLGSDHNVAFLMSHIESPGLFFIHPVAEETQQQIDVLAEQLEEYYGEANLTTMQRYFHSGNLEVHDACVAFYSADNSYYRAQILNTSRPSHTSSVSGDSMSSSCDGRELVEVLYVDYGNREWVSLNKVYPIQPKLSAIPAQAVCCTLSNVVPLETHPEVTLSYDHGGWLKEAVHWFKSNTGYDKQFVGIVDENTCIKKYSLTEPLPMLVVDGARCFNLELARLGMARITELPHMDQVNKGSPGAGSPSEMETSTLALDEWRPMEEDFLSMRNSYEVDTEDAGVALTGHKSVGDRTICRYYARGMRCWLGALCRDKHVRTNPEVCEDQVPAVVMYSDENLVQLPEADTWVRLEVLSVINPSRFYAYLPYGVLPIHADIDEPPATQEFLKLRDTMTEFYEEHPFEHQDLTLYAEGEIVAAKWEEDHYWYRCRVIEVDPDNEKVKVFFLDFGNAIWQKERHVKQIDTQFLSVPFQAVECHLEIKATGEVWTAHAINEFVRFVDGKELVARVIDRLGSRLTVDLNDTSDEKGDINVADRFIHLGHACRVIPPNQPPSSASSRNKRYRMVPG